MVLLGGALILVAAFLVFMATNQENAGVTPTTDVASDPMDAVERISLEDAKSAFDSGSSVFLDVRTDVEYEQSHIPNAIHIPLNQLASRLSELDPAASIITYCT